MTPSPVTRESFARLVLALRAELAEVTEARRRSVLHGPPPWLSRSRGRRTRGHGSTPASMR